MTLQEQQAQYLTELARHELLIQGIHHRDPVQERCDQCRKKRGIGYVTFNENGTTRCLFCQDPLDAEEQPAARLQRAGPASLSDTELLATLLARGANGTPCHALARRLLQTFGSLQALRTQNPAELTRFPGMTATRIQILTCSIDLWRRFNTPTTRTKVHYPAQVHDAMKEILAEYKVETLYALALDSKLQLITRCEITRGLLNSTLVAARELYGPLILARAAFGTLVHNHPSGNPNPSPDDVRITRQMVRAGDTIGIRLVDHVIVGIQSPECPKGYFSFKEAGIIDFNASCND